MGRPTTHGLINTPAYKSWEAMKQRCLNKNHPSYKHYGGRGILISNRWINSFENFLEDMGERPENRSLDRIDNDGNYTPENCRWATTSEQALNKRTSRLFTINGETKTMQELCSIYKIRRKTVYNRLGKGWTPQRAFTEKPGLWKKSKRKIWHKVEDSTPRLCNDEGWRKESDIVLMYSSCGAMFTGIFTKKYDDFDPDDDYPIEIYQYGPDSYQMTEGYVTHWRYLPPKPKD